jgi:hypothetical protein
MRPGAGAAGRRALLRRRCAQGLGPPAGAASSVASATKEGREARAAATGGEGREARAPEIGGEGRDAWGGADGRGRRAVG